MRGEGGGERGGRDGVGVRGEGGGQERREEGARGEGQIRRWGGGGGGGGGEEGRPRKKEANGFYSCFSWSRREMMRRWSGTDSMVFTWS